ncbi:MAG: ribosome maturation factor RimM [bacterium]
MEKLLSIGKILNFHGIQGEVKVGFTEGAEDLFTKIDEIYAIKDSKKITLTPDRVRFHKNFAIIKFKEINSVDEVIELKGAYLKAPKSKTQGFLKEDEFYIDDLVGLSAYDDNENLIGKVSAVSISKGQDILFIKDSENKEHIIPFAKEIVPEVNLKEQKIIIKNIDGLI